MLWLPVHLLATEMVAALAEHDVESSIVRVVDHHPKFGVTTDEGDGDEWPAIREQVLASDMPADNVTA